MNQVFARELPLHQAWECPGCGKQFLNSYEVYHHWLNSSHGMPTVQPRRYADPLVAEPVAVPVGNFLRAGDALRAAISLAEISLELAEQHGAGTRIVATIRNQINQLKGG